MLETRHIYYLRRACHHGFWARGSDWRKNRRAKSKSSLPRRRWRILSVIGALTTAVELGVPVLWVLFNNFCFSTIRTVGTTYFKNAYGTEFRKPDGTPYNPDFPLLAKAFGIEGARVDEPDDLPEALNKGIAADVPYLLEVRTRG